MIDFSGVLGITIPEGEVRSIASGGVILWQQQLEPPSRLPAEYQEVAWIGCTGTQYINTGFLADQNTGVDLQGEFNYTSGSTRFGTRLTPTGTDNIGAFCILSIGGDKLRIAFGSGSLANTQWEPNQKIIANRVVIDGLSKKAEAHFTDGTAIEHTFGGGNFSIAHPILLFAFNNAGAAVQATSMIISACKLYSNGVIARDYVPCYRKSDGKAGMYDLVTEAFFENAGNGDFLYEELS